MLGLFVGFLADCMGSGMMLRPLSYFLLGWLAGSLALSRLAHNMPSFAVFAAVGAAAEGLFRVLSATLSARAVPPVSFLWFSVLPHIVLSVLFSPLVYGVVFLVRRLLGKEKDGSGGQGAPPPAVLAVPAAVEKKQWGLAFFVARLPCL
ncbi:MAG: hypothetical protein L6V84_04640 [Oscillospiraceae bacterium]|nr:MAG: hypothetical protein L6V84_04640 [Oscillospiraceae bacterium]